MSFSNECIEKDSVTTATVIIEKEKNVSENETEVLIFFENEIEVKSRHSITKSQKVLQIMKRQNAEVY
jgi:P2-related tail formation protein